MDWNPTALIEDVRRVVEGRGGDGEKLQRVCDLLTEGVPHYDWVGFYFVNPYNPGSSCWDRTPGRGLSTPSSPSGGASAARRPRSAGWSSSAT